MGYGQHTACNCSVDTWEGALQRGMILLQANLYFTRFLFMVGLSTITHIFQLHAVENVPFGKHVMDSLL